MTQREALDILKTGANIFLTGEPGAGKTHTINEYVAYLRARDIEPSITASTGIAATHIGGMTVHSWSGIGVAANLTPEEVAAIAGRNKIRKRILHTRVLIIDEVSMLSALTLAMVDTVCRAVREINEPFGGLQVVLVGDFFQLPPISRDGSIIPFAYESEVWSTMNPVVCYLTEQYRQDDPLFLSVLSAIRGNTCDSTLRAHVCARSCEPKDLPDDIPKLFPHNAEVNRINGEKLARIQEKSHEFYMDSHGPAALVEFLKKSCLSPHTLELKKGAAVMFTKNNQQERFVNGTLGVVEGFDEDSGYPVVRKRNGAQILVEPAEWALEEGGRVRAKVMQVPLRLAWAMTVHKSQGMSMDAATMDLSDAFEYGQGYVALSRVRRLSGLYLLGINERAFEVHPDVVKKDKEFHALSIKNSRYLSVLGDSELHAKHERFIKKCGGKEPAISSGIGVHHTPSRRKFGAGEKKWEHTYSLIKEGRSIEEVARICGKSQGTIMKHLEELASLKKLSPEDIGHLSLNKEKVISEIHTAFQACGTERLKPVFDMLNGSVPYTIIRLAKLFYKN